MLRRLLLVGLMQIMVESGSALQIVLGTVFAVVFLLFQVQSSPYVSLHDDHLSTSCSFALSTIFLTSIAFKYSSLTDLRDIQEKMSVEQRQTYVMDSSFFVMLLSLSIFGALIASTIIFTLQFAVERRRMRCEALAAKARRLRFVETKEEAEPAPLPEWPTWLKPKHECAPNQVGPFHVLLSHNWAQGQDQMRIVKARLREMLPNISVFLDVDALGNTCFKDFEHIDMSNAVLVFL